MTVRKVPSPDFPTINDALTESAPYDTIRVDEGVFPEMIDISIEGLRLIGAGKGKTIIDGQSLGANDGITINDDLVTIENLTVRNFNGRGVFINVSSNIIHKVQLVNNLIGINLDSGDNIILECEVNESIENGIEIVGNNNYIMHSTLKGNQLNGVFISSSGEFDQNLIYCCIAKQNTLDGFHIGGVESYIVSSTAIKNGGNGFSESGIIFDNVYVFNTSFENCENGFVVDNESLLFENVSKNNGLNGILARNGENRIIHNLVINNKDNGIRVEDSENIIDRNTIKNNGLAGISIAGNETAVRSNCIQGNNPDIMMEALVIDCTFADNDCKTSIPPGLCERNDAIDVKEGDSIQQAVEDAQEGYQINIGAGFFNQQVDIPNSKDRLRIVGVDRCKTIIDGTNIDGDGICVNSVLSSIENLTVQNFGSSGVVFDELMNIIDRVLSKNNTLDGFVDNGTTDTTILFNQCHAIMNKGNGFNSPSTNLNYFIKCIANDNRDHGFIVDDNHLLLFNEVKNNRMNGMTVDNENIMIGNCALNNKRNGIFIDEDNLLFNNKTIENSMDGIRSNDNQNENLIWGNVCNKNKGNGIELNVDLHRIINNVIQLNKTNGIQLNEISSVDSIIDHNCVENNKGAGILIEGAAADNFGVRSNCLSGNNPDIQNNSESTANIAIDENKCDSSIPDGLCEGSCGSKNFFKR
ncbi:right-handed parallel beta-helix repeat-containing protein [Chengkuizengella axinellae]|uniref:Right-handed parallel beta-helix repeat-containing protein n=1 Tax=Chengkuizengella axinellae TaxID=3064388 RepID=A0ABT9IXP6_9BACL|nr:right-handed parallel beta-helix repeat-containing protein [Chengkuizengella sp. 2205SS18-9]MDP5274083.1 right-handed parallel beta-helix repeat-containing protein [Chengkuizengella sp. 2205SS18-9]